MSEKRVYSSDERALLEARIAFAHYSGINIGTAEHFAELNVDPQRFFALDRTSLCNTLGIRPKIADAMRTDAVKGLARKEVDFLEDSGVRPLWYTDPDFPQLLRECSDVPAMLYMLGTPPTSDQKLLAIVGTRHCTPYGRGFIEQLVADLAASVENLVIISGLALGADIAAHRAALKAGIPTGAVMAEGLNRVYPAEHRSDAVRIIRDGGFLLSSYLSSDPTHRGNFLARNRIVAGMTEATIIVESDLRGGAMSTARLANDYQREVLAVPGRVTDQYSRGCNELIAKNTARIVRDASDVLAATGWEAVRKEGTQLTLQPVLAPEQKAILQFLHRHPEATVNDLVVALDTPFQVVSSMLFELELEGFINSIPGGRYISTGVYKF